MKKDKFIINILGTDSEKEEYEQIESWIEEEKLATQDLIVMTQILNDGDRLKDYHSFDTDLALAKTLDRVEARSVKNKSSYSKYSFLPFIIIGIVILTFLGSLVYFSAKVSNAPKLYFAEQQSLIKRVDGTVISLSNNAKLKEWSTKNHYDLKGIASFDVSKQDKPLIISVPQGAITVIGTEFLVNAKNEQTTIDLYEGVLELINEDGQKEKLTQGNRAIIRNNKIIISSFLKKDNKFSFVFKDKPLTEIVNELERRFGVKIKFDALNDETLITSMFIDETIEQIINELSLISGIQLFIKK